MKIAELKAVVEGSKLKAPFTDHEDCDGIIVDADGFDLIDGEFPNEQTKDMVIAVLNHAPAFLELWEACRLLRGEVHGILGAYEYILREVMGNTNYKCVLNSKNKVDAALQKLENI